MRQTDKENNKVCYVDVVAEGSKSNRRESLKGAEEPIKAGRGQTSDDERPSCSWRKTWAWHPPQKRWLIRKMQNVWADWRLPRVLEHRPRCCHVIFTCQPRSRGGGRDLLIQNFLMRDKEERSFWEVSHAVMVVFPNHALTSYKQSDANEGSFSPSSRASVLQKEEHH